MWCREELFIPLELQNLSRCCHIQALKHWRESICKKQISSLATGSQINLGLDFDWATPTHSLFWLYYFIVVVELL